MRERRYEPDYLHLLENLLRDVFEYEEIIRSMDELPEYIRAELVLLCRDLNGFSTNEKRYGLPVDMFKKVFDDNQPVLVEQRVCLGGSIDLLFYGDCYYLEYEDPIDGFKYRSSDFYEDRWIQYY